MPGNVPFTAGDVDSAAKTIRPYVLRTPTLPAPSLSALTGAEVWVKYENLQVTNAFKERGAANRLAHLTAAERSRGVVTFSAGNHAQAVACHAARMGIPATIVMPRTTPSTKVTSTKAYGARVRLEGESVAECRAAVDELIDQQGLVLVHPFDDPLVMAGQGTIALEMLVDAPELDCIMVPVGGGGLISGIAVAAKDHKPELDIVGVQAALYPSVGVARGEVAPPPAGDTLAEGIAVKAVSDVAANIIDSLVADIATVGESEIEEAIYAYLAHQKTLAEGAGAATLAALLAAPDLYRNRRIGLVLSGGNIDPRLVSAITVRALEREDRIVALRVSLRDRPGELGRIATILGIEGANILEVSHQRMLLDVPAMRVTADITVEARDSTHAERIISALEDAGISAERLSPLTGNATA